MAARQPLLLSKPANGCVRVLWPDFGVSTVSHIPLPDARALALSNALATVSKSTRYVARVHVLVEGGQRHLLIDKPPAPLEKLPLSLAGIVQILDNVSRAFVKLHGGAVVEGERQPRLLVHSEVTPSHIQHVGDVFKLCCTQVTGFAGHREVPLGAQTHWPPELWTGQEKSNTPASDVWALAITLIELIFQRPSNAAPSEQLRMHARDPRCAQHVVAAMRAAVEPFLNDIDERLPPFFKPIAKLLNVMLNPDPRRRIPADGIGVALDALWAQWKQEGVLANPIFHEPLGAPPPRDTASPRSPRAPPARLPRSPTVVQRWTDAEVLGNDDSPLPSLAQRLGPTPAHAPRHSLPDRVESGVDLLPPILSAHSFAGDPALDMFGAFNNLQPRPGASLPPPELHGFEGFLPGVNPGRGASDPIPLSQLLRDIDSFLGETTGPMDMLGARGIRAVGPGMQDVARGVLRGQAEPYFGYSGMSEVPGGRR